MQLRKVILICSMFIVTSAMSQVPDSTILSFLTNDYFVCDSPTQILEKLKNQKYRKRLVRKDKEIIKILDNLLSDDSIENYAVHVDSTISKSYDVNYTFRMLNLGGVFFDTSLYISGGYCGFTVKPDMIIVEPYSAWRSGAGMAECVTTYDEIARFVNLYYFYAFLLPELTYLKLNHIPYFHEHFTLVK